MRETDRNNPIDLLPGLLDEMRPFRPVDSERCRADAQALRFHLRDGAGLRMIAVLGGTGTGKSTLVNRLLDQNVCATSFRRTFTAAPVAVIDASARLPEDWLDVPHRPVGRDEWPLRGTAGTLSVALAEGCLPADVAVIDTPDVDGEVAGHAEQADRVFRWSHAAVLVVSPEKYQMTELLAYYRLCRRYGITAICVMNKCENAAMLEDYRRQLRSYFDGEEPPLFAIARDDASWQPPAEAGLESLRTAVANVRRDAAAWNAGLERRREDLRLRIVDTLLEPLAQARLAADRLIAQLRAQRPSEPRIDLNPISRHVEQQLRQRNIFYLIGPGRILKRFKPLLDLVRKNGERAAATTSAPDFHELGAEALAAEQSRLVDLLRRDPVAQRWIEADAERFAQALVPSSEARAIVDEELAALKEWLAQREAADPRRMEKLRKLLRRLPGAQHAARLSEAVPWLLMVSAFFNHLQWPVDLALLGAYGISTWFLEGLLNEVAARTRAANDRIAERFADLVSEQIERLAGFISLQVPAAGQLQRLRAAAEAL